MYPFHRNIMDTNSKQLQWTFKVNYTFIKKKKTFENLLLVSILMFEQISLCQTQSLRKVFVHGFFKFEIEFAKKNYYNNFVRAYEFYVQKMKPKKYSLNEFRSSIRKNQLFLKDFFLSDCFYGELCRHYNVIFLYSSVVHAACSL